MRKIAIVESAAARLRALRLLAALAMLAVAAMAWPVQVAWAQPAAKAPGSPAPGGTASKVLIAVLDFEPAGSTAEEASAISDRLREELLNSGKYILVDRELLSKTLQEQALQQTGCTSAECSVKVGKILGVRKMVSGRITKVGDERWLIYATLVDVETSETERAESVRFRGDYFGLLDVGIEQLAGKLAGLPAAAATSSAGTAPPPAAPPIADPAARNARRKAVREQFVAWIKNAQSTKFPEDQFTRWMANNPLRDLVKGQEKTSVPLRIQIRKTTNGYQHRVALAAKPPFGMRWLWHTNRTDEQFESQDLDLKANGWVLLNRDALGGQYERRMNDGLWVKLAER